ncbi:MAG: DUF2147 domain-containing protein [Brevinema sp.]
MKKVVSLFIFLIAIAGFTHANQANDIVGLWYMPKDKKGRVPVAEIFEKNGKYYAYAFAYQDKSVGTDVDSKNPDAALKSRSLTEVVFIYDLSFDSGSWKKGEIYNPANGKFFHLAGKITPKGAIEWRASIDTAGLFGQTITWQPVQNPDDYTQLRPDWAKIEANIPKSRKM